MAQRFGPASVIVAFPVFLLVARYLDKELARSPAKRLPAVRRWLAYLTLLVAAVVLIVDMATLVNNLPRGELTLRLVLKVVVAAMIAGAVFGD